MSLANTTEVLAQLLDDPDGRVRGAAAQALGRSRDPAAAEVLTQHVLLGRYELVRPAADALSLLDDDRVAELLEPMTRPRDDPQRRRAAARMAGIAVADRLAPPSRDLGALLGDLLRDPDVDVVRSVLDALTGRCPIPVAELQRLAALGDEELRVLVARNLGGTPGIDALDVLVNLLADAGPAVRAEAVRALARIDVAPGAAARDAAGPLSPAVKSIAAMLAAGEVGHRDAAAALANLGGEESVSQLVALLADEDEEVIAIAVSGLAREGSANAVAAVRQRLAQATAGTREELLDAMDPFDGFTIEVLSGVVDGSDPISPSAAELIAEASHRLARLRLEAAIRRGDTTDVREQLRHQSVHALGHIAGDISVPGTGTESDLLHFTVDEEDADGATVEGVFCPVFTRSQIMREGLLRNPDWQTPSVLEIDGGALLDNIDDDVTLVINPWSDLEFQLPPVPGPE